MSIHVAVLKDEYNAIADNKLICVGTKYSTALENGIKIIEDETPGGVWKGNCRYTYDEKTNSFTPTGFLFVIEVDEPLILDKEKAKAYV